MKVIKEIFNNQYFDNKNILITGGTGTLGHVLSEHFLNNTNCHKICIFSRDEFKQYQMKFKFKNNKQFNKFRFLIGDIRDSERIKYACKNIDIEFYVSNNRL